MKRKFAVIFLVTTVLMIVSHTCYAAENESIYERLFGENETQNASLEWRVGHYIDENQKRTGSVYMGNVGCISGDTTMDTGEIYPAYLKIYVDSNGISFCVSEDGQNYVYNAMSSVVWKPEMSILLSSGIRMDICGECQYNQNEIRISYADSQEVIQDLRMTTGETIVEFPNLVSGRSLYKFSIPHNGNFRKTYDDWNAVNWIDTTQVQNSVEEQESQQPVSAETDSSNSGDNGEGSLEFQNQMELYHKIYNEFVAFLSENESLKLDNFIDWCTAYSESYAFFQAWQELENMDVSRLSNVDRQYYEYVKNEYDNLLLAGTISAGISFIDWLFD